MADIAKEAVFASSKHAVGSLENLESVVGPSVDFSDAAYILSHYKTLGFQATHFAQACAITRRMFEPQPSSRNYLIKDGEFVEACIDPPAPPPGEEEEKEGKNPSQAQSLALSAEIRFFPKVFLGMTANLLGTGCREALRFLLQEGIKPRVMDGKPVGCSEEILQNSTVNFESLRQITYRELTTSARDDRDGESIKGTKGRTLKGDERADDSYHIVSSPSAEQPLNYSFLSALVVSGGGMEHDLRRSCEVYHITNYASEEGIKKRNPTKGEGDRSRDATSSRGRFGNVVYGVTPLNEKDQSLKRDFPQGREASLFDVLMRKLIAALLRRQERLQNEMNSNNNHCAIAPSELWALAGLWLEDLMEDALLEVSKIKISTKKMEEEVETKSASELRNAIREEALRRARSTVLYWAALQEVPIFSPSLSDGDIIDYILPMKNTNTTDTANPCSTLLKVDLVRDLCRINRMCMFSKCTGMIICGGGLVKHHIANANLMRNGADYAVLMSNSQEFDGSDAGARPDEAVSWGKIRIDGKSAKVYGEVTTIFPLFVAEVFLPLVRSTKEKKLDRKEQ